MHVVTATSGEIMPLEELKRYLRIPEGVDDEDAEIDGMLQAARREAERISKRTLRPSVTRKDTLCGWWRRRYTFAFPPLRYPVSVRTGTLQAGSTSTAVVLDAGASSTTDEYNGALFTTTGGTGGDPRQTRVINDYNGSTKTIAVDALDTVPDATTTFEIRTVAIEYYDSDNTLQTIDSADYFVVPPSAPVVPEEVSFLEWEDDYSPPILEDDRPDRIFVNFQTGYGSDMDQVAKQAVKIMVYDTYYGENNEKNLARARQLLGSIAFGFYA